MRGILYKMHPKLDPRGRGQSPLPLGASFGCMLYRIPFKNLTKTCTGSSIDEPGVTFPGTFTAMSRVFASGRSPGRKSSMLVVLIVLTRSKTYEKWWLFMGFGPGYGRLNLINRRFPARRPAGFENPANPCPGKLTAFT